MDCPNLVYRNDDWLIKKYLLFSFPYKRISVDVENKWRHDLSSDFHVSDARQAPTGHFTTILNIINQSKQMR